MLVLSRSIPPGQGKSWKAQGETKYALVIQTLKEDNRIYNVFSCVCFRVPMMPSR